MNDEVELWRIRSGGKVGPFDAFTVQGFPYERNDGDRAWHISTWGEYEPVKSYWVSHEKFYRVMIHFDGIGGNRIETYGEVEKLDDTEKTAVLKAINQWESEQKKKDE